MLTVIIYIIIGLIASTGVVYLLLQLWFLIIRTNENKNHLRKIKELGLKNLKFDKKEQFDFLDGKLSEADLLKRYSINETIPVKYFFNIEKVDYVEHLNKFPPNSEWFNDGVSYNIFQKTIGGYYDHSYFKGNKVSSIYYQTNEELLDMIANFRIKKE